jgi:hypothetical protein
MVMILDNGIITLKEHIFVKKKNTTGVFVRNILIY